MAEGFDTVKASFDLKNILKMNEPPHSASVDSKKKNTNRSANIKTKEGGNEPQQPQSIQYSDKSLDTFTNRQSNELLTSVNPSRPESVRHNQKGNTSSGDGQLTRKGKQNNKESTSLAHKTNNNASFASFQNRNTESHDPREVTNYSQRQPSNMKKQNISTEKEFARKTDDSTYAVRKNSSRNFPVKNQRRSKFRNADGGEDCVEKVSSVDSNRKWGKIDGNKQMRLDAEKQNNTDTSNRPDLTEKDDAELTKEFLMSLKENKIKFLIKKNPRFPKANYFCSLCDFHLNIEEDCSKHMKDTRHLRKKKLHEEDTVLKNIPIPTERQYAALTAAVEKVYADYGISVEEKKQRADAVLRLEKVLKEKIPDVTLYMYGSSLTGFGLKTADINVNLTSADKNKKLTTLLKETYASMKDRTDSGFSNVRPDFTAKVPGLYVTDDLTGLTLSIAIHCYKAHCSSQLLSMYSDFDPRVSKLAVAFRYWAHLCKLDRHRDGFIPPQGFNLMVIYFLQQMSPQLVPIVKPPDVTAEETGDFRKDSPAFEKMRAKMMKFTAQNRNHMSVGELWLRLLRFYCLEFETPKTVICIHGNHDMPRNTKPWSSKKLAVEDPYMLKKNVTGMVNQSHVCEYWEDCIRHALHYFGFPRDAEGKSHIPIDAFMKMIQHNETLEAEMTGRDEAAKQSADSDGTVPTNKKEVEHKTEYSKRSQQQNLRGDDDKSSSGSESDDIRDADTEESDDDGVTEDQQSSDSYSLHRQSSASFQAAATSQMKSVSLSNQGNHSVSRTSLENQSLKRNISDSGISAGLSQAPDDGNIHHQTHGSNTSIGTHVSKVTSSETQEKSANSSSCISAEGVTEDTIDHLKLTEAMNSVFLLLEQRDCYYEFLAEFLTDGKGPILICTYCEKEGHLKNACPDDRLPEILPLPSLTGLHVRILSETLSKVPAIVGLSVKGSSNRVNFLKDLEAFIRTHFDDANLTLFGSSCNGFGFEKSDMDICLTFSQRKVNDKPWVIESLARKMKQSQELLTVQAISTAKVPIVKFTVRSLGLEGDISLYNILAQHNTRLLLCYSRIDPRVRILGYAIKNFAKVCDIGDASRGSLSSYAYILMMIYYLQQVSPPVVPVLQELYEGKDKPQVMVEDCDVWFMGDLTKLNTVWMDKGKNKMSVAELWIGFLRFYVEEFNCKEIVVSIRQKEPVTRFDKLWNGESIAIEDPFDHSHNLGSGLSRKMNNFIFKTFINGRMLHGSPIDSNMDMFKKYRNPYDYFFDPELLSECRPPNVRGCHYCGKMGHLARQCPTRKAKEQQNKQQKPFQPQKKQQLPPPPQLKQEVPVQDQHQKYPLLSQQDNQRKQTQSSQPQLKQLTLSVQQQKQPLEPKQPNLPSQQTPKTQQLQQNNRIQVQQPNRQTQPGEQLQPEKQDTKEVLQQEQQQCNKVLEQQENQRQPLQPQHEDRKQSQPLCEPQQLDGESLQPKQHQKNESSQLQKQQRQPLLNQPAKSVHLQEHERVQPSYQKQLPQTPQQLEHLSSQPSQTQQQQQMQPFQSQQQQQRPPPHQQHQVSQSLQPQQQHHQPFMSQQHQHALSSEPRFRQPYQHQIRHPALSHHDKHAFQFQQQPSQPQTQRQNQYSQQHPQSQPQHPQSQPQQQYHHSQPQNYHQQQLQQPVKKEEYDSKQEQNNSQKSKMGNMNSPQEPAPPFNFLNHQGHQPAAPTVPEVLHSQVFHNTNYMQQRHPPQHYQQHQFRGYMHNPLMLAPANGPQSQMSQSFNAFGNRPMPVHPNVLLQSGYPQATQASHNPGSGYSTQTSHNPGYFTQASHNPGYSTQASHNPGYSTQASHNPGYSTQASHNPRSGYPHNNSYNKGPHTGASMQHSGQSGGGSGMNGQFMNPAVQHMFDSAGKQ